MMSRDQRVMTDMHDDDDDVDAKKKDDVCGPMSQLAGIKGVERMPSLFGLSSVSFES